MLKFYLFLLFICCFTLSNSKATVKPVSFKDLDFAINLQSETSTKKIPTTPTKQPLQLNFDNIYFSINGSKTHQNATEETNNTTSTGTGNKCNRNCRKLLLGRNRRNCCRHSEISRTN